MDFIPFFKKVNVSSVFDNLPDGLILTDFNGKILFTNTYAKERNNVSSLRKSGSTEFKTFDSVEECISETAKLLKNY